MDCIKIHTIRAGKIDGKDPGDFAEECEESTLYLIDIDAHNRREMNFKVYEELSGIFELWIDSAPRRHYDVMDALVIGGAKVTVTPHFIRWREIERALELTENIVLKSYRREDIEKFVERGGKEIITSTRMAPMISSEVWVLKGGEICKWRT